jgi:acetylornithine aminotransferase
MSLQEAKKLDSQYLMQTYGRADVEFVRGEGMHLYDDTGKEYTDFLAGIGCVALGHSNPAVVAAVQEQISQLGHVSNLFYCAHRGETAALLNGMLNTLPDGDLGSSSKINWRVFFGNSGAEANECAIKLARKYGKEQLRGANVVVSVKRSFHGRTLATLAATGQDRFHEDFFKDGDPNFAYAEFNDLDDITDLVENRLQGQVCAVILECIQGEGGVWPHDRDYLRAVRRLTAAHQILLIIDEVQTGLYRTGKYPFSYAQAGILPDVVTIAKGIANGFPTAACAARGNYGHILGAGDHGSTFGGNVLAMAAAQATLEQMQALKVGENSEQVGAYLRAGLAELPHVSAVRGSGLMVGASLDVDKAFIAVAQMLEAGFVINATSIDVLRFLPPLICTKEDVDKMLGALGNVLKNL